MMEVKTRGLICDARHALSQSPIKPALTHPLQSTEIFTSSLPHPIISGVYFSSILRSDETNESLLRSHG